jgi:hypothetical protein
MGKMEGIVQRKLKWVQKRYQLVGFPFNDPALDEISNGLQQKSCKQHKSIPSQYYPRKTIQALLTHLICAMIYVAPILIGLQPMLSLTILYDKAENIDTDKKNP